MLSPVSSPRPVRRHVNNAWSWGWFISQLVKIFLLFIISAPGGEETSDGQYHGSILSGNFAGKLGNLGSRLRATEQRCQQHSTIYVCKIRKNTESKKAWALHFPVSGYDIACRCSPPCLVSVFGEKMYLYQCVNLAAVSGVLWPGSVYTRVPSVNIANG